MKTPWRINSRFFHPTRWNNPQKLRFGTWKLGPPGIFGDSELGSNHHFGGPFVSFPGWEMSFVFVGILLGGDLVTKSSAGKRCTSFLRPPNLMSNQTSCSCWSRLEFVYVSIILFGSTALHFCGSTTSQDFKGITPLGYAIGANRIAVVKLLLDPRLWVCWDQRFDWCDLKFANRFGQKICRSKRLNFIRFGWMFRSWWFHFPTRRFVFSNLALLGKMIIWLFFTIGSCWKQWFGVMLPLCLLWFFFCASTNPSSFQKNRQFNRQNVYWMHELHVNSVYVLGGWGQVEGFSIPRLPWKGDSTRRIRLWSSKQQGWSSKVYHKSSTSHHSTKYT